GGQVAAMEHPYPGLLVHLACHRLLRRLAGLDETGQHRPAPGYPAGLPSKQQPLAVADGHDHGRIDPRVVVAAAAGAVPDEAAALEFQALAAGAAMPAARAPVQHPASV